MPSPWRSTPFVQCPRGSPKCLLRFSTWDSESSERQASSRCHRSPSSANELCPGSPGEVLLSQDSTQSSAPLSGPPALPQASPYARSTPPPSGSLLGLPTRRACLSADGRLPDGDLVLATLPCQHCLTEPLRCARTMQVLAMVRGAGSQGQHSSLPGTEQGRPATRSARDTCQLLAEAGEDSSFSPIWGAWISTKRRGWVVEHSVGER